MSEETPQHLVAFQLANEVRLERARIKGRVRRGETKVWHILEDPPPCFNNCSISELLKCVHNYGTSRVNKILNTLRISPIKTIGSMTERQRTVVAQTMRTGKDYLTEEEITELFA